MKPFYNYFFEGLKPEISVEQLMKKTQCFKIRYQESA
jgi:hypothetical protein